MPSQGPNTSGTQTNDASSGSVIWYSMGDVVSNNNTYAYTGLDYGTSNYMVCTNFGFNIPSGATIDGIIVDIERGSDQDDFFAFTTDYIVKLVKGGTISGNNKATFIHYPEIPAFAPSYGSSSDLWGLSWTHSDINSSSFGVALSCAFNLNSKLYAYAYVDVITITIHYTGGSSVTAASSLLIAGN